MPKPDKRWPQREPRIQFPVSRPLAAPTLVWTRYSPLPLPLKFHQANIDQADLEDLAISDAASNTSDEDSEADELDPIAVERKRRARRQDRLRRTAGEPAKPEISEILKLTESFGGMLRRVLAG